MCGLLGAGLESARQANAQRPPEGVALAIVYDTSGSMLQNVRDADGRLTPKHVIAKRALTAVLDRLQALTAGPEGPRLNLHAGLVVFEGDHADFAVKFGPFRPAAFRTWLLQQDRQRAGTPLGDAVRVAGQAVLNSNLPRKHILVITDGINTKGADPTVTWPKVLDSASRQQAKVSCHFVAFDVNAEVFSGVKKLGATVMGAADEKQLNSQLEFILEKKILLEDEEPAPAKTTTN